MNEYQIKAGRTLIYAPGFPLTDNEIMLTWMGLGLSGESGEVNDLLKKAIYHRKGLDRDELIKELGDVLWYVAAICSLLDVDMDMVMEGNIDKLLERYPEGWVC